MFQSLFGRGGSHDGESFDGIQYIPTLNQAPKYRMKVVKVRLPLVTNKKLRAVRVGA